MDGQGVFKHSNGTSILDGNFRRNQFEKVSASYVSNKITGLIEKLLCQSTWWRASTWESHQKISWLAERKSWCRLKTLGRVRSSSGGSKAVGVASWAWNTEDYWIYAALRWGWPDIWHGRLSRKLEQQWRSVTRPRSMKSIWFKRHNYFW